MSEVIVCISDYTRTVDCQTIIIDCRLWLLFARQIISILLHPKLFFNREASEEEKLRNEELEIFARFF